MKKFLFILTACSLLLCCQQGETVQDELACGCGGEWPPEDPTCKKELVWDYPVKPGTEEYEELKLKEELLPLLQIPEDILFSLSTEDLAKICLQFPFYFAAGHINDTFNNVITQFNGMRELFNREDVLKELLKQYRCLMFRWDNEDLSEEQRAYMLIGDINNLETLLRFCDSQEKDIYIDIIQHLVCGKESQIKINGSACSKNYFSRAHTIIKIDEKYLEKIPRGIQSPVLAWGGGDMETLQIIDEISCQLIKSINKK